MSQRVIDWLSAGFLLALGLSQLALAALIGAFALGFGGLFASLALKEESLDPLIGGAIFGGMGVLFTVILVFQGLPAVIGGFALFSGKDWGRVVGLVAGALSLANFPVGTILGGMSLCLILYGWTMRKKQPA